MANSFDGPRSSRPEYHRNNSYTYARDSRTPSEPRSRNVYPSAASAQARGHTRRRRHTLRAFVEDEHDSLAREYNPYPDGIVTPQDGDSQSPGDIDQVPILIEVPGAASPPHAPTPPAPSSHVSAGSSATSSSTPAPSTITPTASTITSTASTVTVPPVDNSEYEANTCRKFTIPRFDAESVLSEPSTIASEAEDTVDSRAHTYPAVSDQDNTAGGGSGGTAAAVAAAVTAAAAAATSAATATKTEPETRRRSRADLPRLETDGKPSSKVSSSSRTRTAVSDRHTGEHYYAEHDSRDRLGDRQGHRDNDFLSPAITKYSVNGRERTYFDHGHGPNSAAPGLGSNPRARSGDPRPLNASDYAHRRRSTSFSETDKPRVPLGKRPLRGGDGYVGDGRRSPSPPPTQSRDQVVHDRERDRPDRDRDWRSPGKSRERLPPAHRDALPRRRRDSVTRTDNGYSSEERSERTDRADWYKMAGASTPLRRQNSDRRRAVYNDDDTVVSKASSNPETRHSSTAVDAMPNSSSRLWPSGTMPQAMPRQTRTQFSYPTGSPPKEPFEPVPSTPSRSYGGDRRRKDDRRPESSSSTSSSPETHARVLESDRPRGPRPRALGPNVVHNPNGPSISLPNLPPTRASTVPVPAPIAIPIPVPAPSRNGAGSPRDRAEDRYERRRSPVRTVHPPLSASAVRTSGIFANSPSTTQPHRQPAFYIKIPGAVLPEDERVAGAPDGPRERRTERPANPNGSNSSVSGVTAERPVRPPLPTLYRRYAEDVYLGRTPGLPECPRQRFSTDYSDWRTLSPFPDFLVCPTCFEAAFAPTPYRGEFVPAPAFPPNEKTRCTFGTMQWYRVAFFFSKAFQMENLNLLRTMFEKDEQLRMPCSGPNRVMGRWFTVQDPVTARPVTRFSTCEQCATAVQVLFPRLKGLLQDNDPSRHETTNICALYYEPDRRRLWRYIDVLETANNAAAATNAPVDANELVNRLLDVGRFDECKRDIPVRGRRWYWMRSLPDFLVCPECFDEAVFPLVNTYRTVAGDFFKEPRELPLGACQLYSPRMRDIFSRACQDDDKDYLRMKLRERNKIAADISERIKRLPPAAGTTTAEQKRLLAEWREWE